MSQNDDKKTDRDKLFAEQRAIKDSIKGPANLQVRLVLAHTHPALLSCCLCSCAAVCSLRPTQPTATLCVSWLPLLTPRVVSCLHAPCVPAAPYLSPPPPAQTGRGGGHRPHGV